MNLLILIYKSPDIPAPTNGQTCSFIWARFIAARLNFLFFNNLCRETGPDIDKDFDLVFLVVDEGVESFLHNLVELDGLGDHAGGLDFAYCHVSCVCNRRKCSRGFTHRLRLRPEQLRSRRDYMWLCKVGLAHVKISVGG